MTTEPIAWYLLTIVLGALILFLGGLLKIFYNVLIKKFEQINTAQQAVMNSSIHVNQKVAEFIAAQTQINRDYESRFQAIFRKLDKFYEKG